MPVVDVTMQAAVEEALGYTFSNPDLLTVALTHASVAETRQVSNERLEFLGDAVLGMVVCDALFRRFPDMLEGDLTKIKSAVVSRRTCAAIARKLGLDGLLILGKGMSNRPDLPSSLAAAVYESIIAAVYLDGGFHAAQAFILRSMNPVISRAVASGHQQNFKSLLQQYAQKNFGQNANYILLDENGPDHAKCFEMCVEIGARRFPSHWSDSKKRAEQGAALNSMIELGLAFRDDETGDIVLTDRTDTPGANLRPADLAIANAADDDPTPAARENSAARRDGALAPHSEDDGRLDLRAVAAVAEVVEAAGLPDDLDEGERTEGTVAEGPSSALSEGDPADAIATSTVDDARGPSEPRSDEAQPARARKKRSTGTTKTATKAKGTKAPKETKAAKAPKATKTANASKATKSAKGATATRTTKATSSKSTRSKTAKA